MNIITEKRAKALLEKFNYNFVAMEDANADIVYKKFNVPKDVEREWFIEGCKKRIQQFQQKLLLGTDASEDLWIICNSFKSYLTDNEITFLFNLINSNADRMTAEVEKNHYLAFINMICMTDGFPNVSDDTKNAIIAHIKDRLEKRFATDPQFKEKYSHLYNACVRRLGGQSGERKL